MTEWGPLHHLTIQELKSQPWKARPTFTDRTRLNDCLYNDRYTNSQSCGERETHGKNAPQAGHASHRKTNSRAQTPPNGKLRTREYLTEAEVEWLLEAAKGNRYGHRDAAIGADAVQGFLARLDTQATVAIPPTPDIRLQRNIGR